MPMPIANIQALQQAAQAGDPQAQQQLQAVMAEMQGQPPGPPQGGPPMGGPPQGQPPQPQMPPPPTSPDVLASQAEALIALLRQK